MTGLTAGQALKMRALDLGADLLLMGTYGHTRISELVFGGATDLQSLKPTYVRWTSW